MKMAEGHIGPTDVTPLSIILHNWPLFFVSVFILFLTSKMFKPEEGLGEIVYFEEQLKNVINTNLISFLNVAANVKIINRNYQGENFGKVICQKMVYNLGSRQIVVISGIEKTFLIRVAEMIYGVDIEDEMDLVLYSMQTFGANFWRSIGQYFVGNHDLLSLSSNSFIVASSIPEELDMLKPEKSLLFDSDMGKFFIASNGKMSEIAYF